MYTTTTVITIIMNKTVLIGLSGGVDSSISAHLLKKDGYTLYGVFFVMSDLHFNALNDAQKCADFFSIPLKVLDLRDIFKEKVINPFIDMYSRGQTPNPCVLCNPLIKFMSMVKYADEHNIDYIATGHYAKIVEQDGKYSLKTPKASNKDQTYMLYRLNQDTLKRLIFPLNQFNVKDDVRKLASEIGLFTAKKPDSQDICFIEDGDYAGYIKNATNKQSKIGNFISPNGEIVGQHKGIVHYTVGQRKGLGIALGQPCFVKSIDAETGDVYLAFSGDNLTSTVILKDINYMFIEDIKSPIKAYVKLRSSAKPSPAVCKKLADGNIELTFDIKQKLPSPGQSGVLYDENNILLAGGTII